jgi:hypothetical protein
LERYGQGAPVACFMRVGSILYGFKNGNDSRRRRNLTNSMQNLNISD